MDVDGFQKVLKPIRLKSAKVKPTTTTIAFDLLVDVAGGELQVIGEDNTEVGRGDSSNSNG